MIFYSNATGFTANLNMNILPISYEFERSGLVHEHFHNALFQKFTAVSIKNQQYHLINLLFTCDTQFGVLTLLAIKSSALVVVRVHCVMLVSAISVSKM